MDRCTGRHCRPVLQLPTGQTVACKLLALTENKPPALLTAMILAHMAMYGGKAQCSKMDGGKANLNGANELEMGSGDGRQRWQANKQPAEQGTAVRHSRRTLRSAQAS